MTSPILAAAAATEAAPWRWDQYEAIIDCIPDEAKEAWQDFDWQTASEKYRGRIVDLYGTTQILGQSHPVPLSDIHTDIYVLEKPPTFRRFDTRQFCKDPYRLRSSMRVHGRILLHQHIAHRLFILGKPGAGKTTFLKLFAFEATKGNLDRVPIFVILKEWVDSGEDLFPFIARQFAICGFPDAVPFIQHLLTKTDDVLLLLDGLDEIPRESGAHTRAIAALRNFSLQYDRPQCLITCCTVAAGYTFTGFVHIKVTDFTDEQMETFVRKWFHAAPAKAETFLQEIAEDRHQDLRELARVPPMLAMLCLAFNDTLHFPLRHVEIYEDAFDTLLRKWDKTRNIQRDEVYRTLSLRRKHQLLAYIAAQTFDRGDYIPQDDLETQIASYLSRPPRADAAGAEIDGAAILKAIEAQHGILVEHTRRIYSFAHPSFHEYYVARYVVTSAAQETIPWLLAHCTDARWHKVILLTSSLLDNADVFFVHFRRALDDIVIDEENLVTLLHWAADKSADIGGGGAIRVYYAYLALVLALNLNLDLDRVFERSLTFDLNLDCALNSDLDLALSLGLDFAYTLALDLALVLDLDRAFDSTLDRTRIFDLTFDRTRTLKVALDRNQARALALDRTLTLAHAHARNLARARAHNRARTCARAFALEKVWRQALNLSWELGEQELHKTLLTLFPPSFNSSAGESQTFIESLQRIMIKHRNIGHDWQLTCDQAYYLSDYYRANLLLLKCLDLAVVSNRQAIKDSLLLPPGVWNAEDLAG